MGSARLLGTRRAQSGHAAELAARVRMEHVADELLATRARGMLDRVQVIGGRGELRCAVASHDPVVGLAPERLVADVAERLVRVVPGDAALDAVELAARVAAPRR